MRLGNAIEEDEETIVDQHNAPLIQALGHLRKECTGKGVRQNLQQNKNSLQSMQWRKQC